MKTAIRRPTIRAIALIFAMAATGLSSAQSDNGPDLHEHGLAMTPVPRTKTGVFAGDQADASRQQDAQEVDHSKDDWPTDDFGQPLRGCDVPWDFVPLPPK